MAGRLLRQIWYRIRKTGSIRSTPLASIKERMAGSRDHAGAGNVKRTPVHTPRHFRRRPGDT
jgi:hypothetical protein